MYVKHFDLARRKLNATLIVLFKSASRKNSLHVVRHFASCKQPWVNIVHRGLSQISPELFKSSLSNLKYNAQLIDSYNFSIDIFVPTYMLM
jgi:hypothetical protein